MNIAPLLSALIGVAIPSNSLGALPLSYLHAASPYYRYSAAMANYNQLKALFTAKRAEKYNSSFRALFREFSELSIERMQ